MNKHIKVDKLLISIAVIGIVIVLVLLILLGGYSPDYSCDQKIRDMLIEDSSFPGGWVRRDPIIDDKNEPQLDDYCQVSFEVEDGVANERIYKYEDEDSATRRFNSKLASEFTSKEGLDSAWKVHDRIDLSDINAEDYHLACAEVGYTPMCRFIGRYGSYIVLFNTHFRSEFMSDTDLKQIILTIDQRMTEVINSR
jgi:hypothetical protein